MTLESLLMLLIYVVVIVGIFCVAGWGAIKIIDKLVPPDWQQAAKALVGFVMLLVLLFILVDLARSGGVPRLPLRS